MSLLDKIIGEFIDIIEWLEDGSDTLIWRFPRYQNEIKNNAKLTVREGQVAIFVNEGKVADVFQPGMYTLNTKNLPILSTLKGWKYGFDSPFKAEVYFISTRRFTDQKWGTRNPIILKDPEIGPVRIRAYGTYILQSTDPLLLLKEVLGSKKEFSMAIISEQIRNLIVAAFADAIGESKIGVFQLAENYDTLSVSISQKIAAETKGYGLSCSQLLIENISLPEEAERSIDKKSSMGVVGEQDYTRYQMATAAEAAAKNSGEASGGIGLGMGIGMAQQMTQSVSNPPPIPSSSLWWVAINGQKNGPHSLEALSTLFQQNNLNGETLVWKQGMDNWSAAKSRPELSSLLNQTPPPIPEK